MTDTTKKNMGRRGNPACSGTYCQRRVDKPGDELCRVCSGQERARPPRRRVDHRVRH